MGQTARILLSAFYLLLLRFDQFVLANPAEDRSITDQARPAEAACERYKKMVTGLGQSAQPDESTSPIGTVPGANFQAKLGEYPYMAAVGYNLSKDGEAEKLKYPCGGTLISERHVLTAGHCGMGWDGKLPVEVLLGAIDQDKTKLQMPGVQRIPVSRIITHPEFDGKYRYHDISILELKDPIKFTNQVNPACLMTEPLTTTTNGADNSLVVLTWRDSVRSEDSTIKLLKIEKQRFVGKEECSKSYGPESASRSGNIPNGLSDEMFCVGKSDASTNSADACWGISGAPVLVPSVKSGLLTAGFPLFGHKCEANKPTVFMSVHKNLKWIEDVVWPAAAAA